MPVYQKVTIRRVLILAHPRLSNRRVRQKRYSFRQIFAHRDQPRLANHALPSVRIESWSMCINRNLETTAIEIWNSVNEIVEIDPRWQNTSIESIVSRWNSDEENLLPRDMNQLAEQ